jgi:hypothetical protein
MIFFCYDIGSWVQAGSNVMGVGCGHLLGGIGILLSGWVASAGTGAGGSHRWASM